MMRLSISTIQPLLVLAIVSGGMTFLNTQAVAQAAFSASSPQPEHHHSHEDAKPSHSGRVVGEVLDAVTREPIPFVTLRVPGTSGATSTDVKGHFILHVSKVTGTLRVTSVGYKTLELPYDVSKKMTILLEPTSFDMNEIVVSASRTETTRRSAPVMVNVTDAKLFNATASTSLDQALKFNPGVRVEDNCQNCGFNQVRINGLDGPYSQILINSRNIFSNLASVYGLEMLPTEMIDRIEVVRGGGSTLYGSNAIGGTINIITKAPLGNQTEVSYRTELFQDNMTSPAHNMNVYSSVVDRDHKAGVSVFGRMQHRPGLDFKRPGSKLEGLRDGYTEMPRIFSTTIGTSAFLLPSSEGRLTLDYFYTQEERRGGDLLDRPEHESHIAESLRHRMHTGVVKYDHYLFGGDGILSGFVGGSHTYRNSYYGGGPVTADDIAKTKNPSEDDLSGWAAALNSYGHTSAVALQYGLQYVHNFDRLIFMPSELTLGIEENNNTLEDHSGIRSQAISQRTFTTAGFAQNEWKNEVVGLLLGLRYDHVHFNDGVKSSAARLKHLNILTPRITARYNPFEDMTLRASYAEGFRAPAYFDEELHVAFANGEGKPRVLADDLREERSRSITASMDYYYAPEGSPFTLNLMLEGFSTRILNKFTPVEKDGITLIRNKDEEGNITNARVYGANAEARLAYASMLSLQLGFTLQRSLYDTPQEVVEDVSKTREFMRTPNHYGYFVLSYMPIHDLTFNLSGDYTGKMHVPHEHGDKEGNFITNSGDNMVNLTKPFYVLNTKVSYPIHIHHSGLELSLGINNIFNSYQKDFDEGPNRASAYIYGPKAPRSVMFGLKFKPNIH